MNKLNSTQIGLLSKYVEQAMLLNTTNNLVDSIDELADMEPWEVELKRLVDADSLLPNYVTMNMDHSEILEALIGYFIYPFVDLYQDHHIHGEGKNT